MPMIEVMGLSRKFGDFYALRDVNLTIAQGESFALLGPNGAGKTTLVRVLSALLKPSSGSARINGYDVMEEAEEVKKRIGVVSHNPFLYDELTARENLEFYHDLYGMQDRGRIDHLLKKAGLEFRSHDPVAHFSRGMKQRLSIVRSILHGPRVLILDEPTTGLDLQSKQAFYEMVKDQSSRGITVLFTTHYLQEAEGLCQKAAIIDEGRIVALGKITEIKSEVETLEEAFVRLTGKG